MAKKNQSDFNFERALENLEEIVSSMEKGDLTLEDSLKAFERGIKLTRECQAALKDAEQKVRVLSKDNGETEEMLLEEKE
ncbi:MAG: exodeoxyribonuclease VII small subunit [Gammaproteobacteria bacterium]|nr:exodeoxyribonuclease VII small subunit [Gammaproteobacteria bacterium]